MESKFTIKELGWQTIIRMIIILGFIAMPMLLKAQTVTLDYKNQPLDVVLKSITDQTGYKFVYSGSVIDRKQLVSVTVSSSDINTLLKELFKNTNITYSIVAKQVALTTSDTSSNKEKGIAGSDNYFSINGTISDNENQPLIGVTILNQNTGQGTVSDLDGNYSIRAKNGDILVYRYVGMESKEVKVDKVKTTINILMNANENVLENVVVTGYQTISKERATGSYTILTNKDIVNKTETNLMARVEGMIPGINDSGDSRLSASQGMTIRGNSTLEGQSSVLYIVDGVPYESDRELKYINPNDVVNMTVLKDAAAASIYGARAANGVVVITTRSGQEGKIKVSYNSAIHFSRPPSLKHQNQISSKELVDYYQTVYGISTFKNLYNKRYNNGQGKEFVDPVFESLIQYDKNIIDNTELQRRLGYYSSLNNRDQIYDTFSRTSLTHQHNIGVSGGGKNYKFALSMNYMENYKHDKYDSSKRYGINSKNEFDITSKLKMYANISANYDSSTDKNYRANSYSTLLSSYPSYYMIKDESGGLLKFPSSSGNSAKSQYEIDRLIGIGLKDETYYPTLDMETTSNKVKNEHIRFQTGINWDIIDGLSFNGLYQLEISNTQEESFYGEHSYFMRSNINNAAQHDKDTQEITYNIPLGGRLDKHAEKVKSYTLRGQFDYNKTFNEDHIVNALVGLERRQTRTTSFGNVFLGFNDNGYTYDQMINPLIYTDNGISGTESLSGYFFDGTLSNSYPSIRSPYDDESRFVSFYGNASYSYKGRYDISGSMRIDETNLFGRATNNKYKPTWSVGVGWHISEESFMQNIEWINKLVLRTTYGLGGSINTHATPYPKLYSLSPDGYTLENAIGIVSPANPNLRWESTATTNLGFEFAVLNSRIRGSFDYYQKRTTDLLGYKTADPTRGFKQIYVNYGSMDNNGFEISLNSTNIKTKNFQWDMGFTFGYNKNELRNVTSTSREVMRYLTLLVHTPGKPLAAVYSTRYAGLNNAGIPLFYKKNDEVVEYSKLSVDDLVFSGTRTPKYSGAVMNSISFKNFDLSFKIVYYGGHVIRVQQHVLGGTETGNFNRRSLNYWKQPGDELDASKSPGVASSTFLPWVTGWNAIDKNIEKGDFVKLRNINLMYRFPKSITNKLHMEQLSASFQINDLLTWTANGEDDPEFLLFDGYQNYTPLPKSRPSFSFGININF